MIKWKKWERTGVLVYGVLLAMLLGTGMEQSPETIETGTIPSVYKEGSAGEEEKSLLRIALTFDDGPNPASTVRLLDGLKERNVKATFFLIGSCAEENPEIVKRMYEEGHLIGNHTYHHVKLSGLTKEEAGEEILAVDRLVREITGNGTELVRPPFGEWREDLELELEVMPVMWTIDPLDWTTENTDEIVDRVVTKAEENAIILLHDCYESSVDAALRIVDILHAQNYEFVTVDQLLLD